MKIRVPLHGRRVDIVKILTLGNNYFTHAFRLLGHDAKWAAHDPHADIVFQAPLETRHHLLDSLPAGWSPDLVVVGDDSGYPALLGLESLAVPLVWYAIDSHIHESWHCYYAAAFDVVFVAQQDWLPTYRMAAARQYVAWAPLFCNLSGDRCTNVVRDLPLSFVGTLHSRRNPRRTALLADLQAQIPITVQQGPYVDLFNRSMMVLNQSVAGDVNFRTFEAMACGALLITERTANGFDHLFQDRRHCAVYEKDDVGRIREIVDYYRGHRGEREAIAEAGHREVMSKHTSRHRAQTILEAVATQPMQDFVTRRCSTLPAIQWAQAFAYESAAASYRAAAASPQYQGRQMLYARVAEQYQSLATVIRAQLGPLLAA